MDLLVCVGATCRTGRTKSSSGAERIAGVEALARSYLVHDRVRVAGHGSRVDASIYLRAEDDYLRLRHDTHDLSAVDVDRFLSLPPRPEEWMAHFDGRRSRRLVRIRAAADRAQP